MDPERLAALRLAKLRALAPLPGGVEHTLAFGPVLRRRDEAHALIGDRAAIAGAVVWALRHGVARLDLILVDSVADDATTLAGTAESFDRPTIRYLVVGSTGSIEPVEPVSPRPVASPLPSVPTSVQPLLAVLREHGVDPVSEPDAVVGEIAGLEVARIDLRAEVPAIAVGVGEFDRDLNRMIAESRSGAPTDQLAIAARAVRSHRRPGAPPHPLNRLRRERWIRSELVADPAAVGEEGLVPLPPLPVKGLRVASPAPALAAGVEPSLVVCSTGVDPNLIVTAVELRQRYAPAAALKVVVAEGDDYPVTRELAAALRGEALVMTVPAPWA